MDREECTVRSRVAESDAEKRDNPRRVLDIAAACEYLSVGDKVIRKLVREGRLQRVTLSPKRYLFDIQDLDRLVESEKSEPTAEFSIAARPEGSAKFSGKKAKPFEWCERFGVKR
jgi:excisionase family DNA binding protein